MKYLAVWGGWGVCSLYSHQTFHNHFLIISFLAIPPPTVGCSLISSFEGVDVSIEWSPSFTSQHAVERYRVSVTPDPSSCSNNHTLAEIIYSCPELMLQTTYNFTISAITICGDQESDRTSLLVQPQGIILSQQLPLFDKTTERYSSILLQMCIILGSSFN